MLPQRPVRGEAAVSTPSVGITNSEVAVEPFVTVIEVGLKVMDETVVDGHGLLTVRVYEVAVGEKLVVDWPESVTVMVFARLRV